MAEAAVDCGHGAVAAFANFDWMRGFAATIQADKFFSTYCDESVAAALIGDDFDTGRSDGMTFAAALQRARLVAAEICLKLFSEEAYNEWLMNRVCPGAREALNHE